MRRGTSSSLMQWRRRKKNNDGRKGAPEDDDFHLQLQPIAISAWFSRSGAGGVRCWWRAWQLLRHGPCGIVSPLFLSRNKAIGGTTSYLGEATIQAQRREGTPTHHRQEAAAGEGCAAEQPSSSLGLSGQKRPTAAGSMKTKCSYVLVVGVLFSSFFVGSVIPIEVGVFLAGKSDTASMAAVQTRRDRTPVGRSAPICTAVTLVSNSGSLLSRSTRRFSPTLGGFLSNAIGVR